MPKLVAIVLAILVILNLIEGQFFIEPDQSSAFSFVIEAIRSFLLTPFLIAVHRYILLDEVTSRFTIAPQESRFLRFFGWSLLLSALQKTGSLVMESLPDSGLPFPVGVASGIVVLIFVSIVIIRLTILFPAIAVDAPGATFTNAFADTKGFFWPISAVMIMASLPVIILVFLCIGLQFFLIVDRNLVAEALTIAGAELVIYPLLVAIASRLFRALSDRTRQTDS